jgi:hypothetical protein
MHPQLLIDPEAFSIRSAMGEPFRHPLEQQFIDGPNETD